MRYFFLLFFILSFSLSKSVYSQKFEISSIPDWVVAVNPVIVSKVSQYDISSGVYTSLFDSQINLGIGADFSHYIANVLTKGGVSNASEIYISYDTSYQSLTFHYLYIWRNGKKIDRTDELSFESLKNEENLQSGIYTGLITAYDILDDIRKDDKIEYAYTIFGDNPIFNDKHYRLMPLEDTNPVDFFSLRILYPENQPYYSDCEGCDEMKMSKETQNGNHIIEMTRSDLPARNIEETTPSWIIPYNYFAISGFKDWKEVNDWAIGVFELKQGPDLSPAFDEIFIGDEDTEEKINALVEYVQNDIRYMGIETGIGSIKPFPPDQVVKQRYGDCKDKSLLLVSLLKKIGVETAYPVLLSTTMQHGLKSMLAGGQLFDHCIVLFEFEGQEFWIDPTMSQQGGDFRQKIMNDYGTALVVRPGENQIKDMNIVDDISRSEVLETLRISSFDEPGELKVTTKMYGFRADILRAFLEYYSIKELSDEFKGAYSALFPNITESEKLQISDDKKKNEITITEHYSVSNIWKDENNAVLSKREFQFEPVALYNYVNLISCESKKFPVQIPFPSNFSQSTIIELPDIIKVNPVEQKIENSAFTYQKSIEVINDQSFRINYRYKSISKEIVPENFEQICMQMNELVRDLPLVMTFPKKNQLNKIQVPVKKQIIKN